MGSLYDIQIEAMYAIGCMNITYTIDCVSEKCVKCIGLIDLFPHSVGKLLMKWLLLLKNVLCNEDNFRKSGVIVPQQI